MEVSDISAEHFKKIKSIKRQAVSRKYEGGGFCVKACVQDLSTLSAVISNYVMLLSETLHFAWAQLTC